METILVACQDEKTGRHIKYRLLGYGYRILNMSQEALFSKNDLTMDLLLLEVEDVSDLQYVEQLKNKYSCEIIVLIPAIVIGLWRLCILRQMTIY